MKLRMGVVPCSIELHVPLQIADTKSGTRKDFNLLHFVVDTIETLVRLCRRACSILWLHRHWLWLPP